MPRTPDSLTTYDLLHTPGIYAALSPEDGDVVLTAVRLSGITTTKDGSTSPTFRACTGTVDCDYHHDADEILFEPYELPQILRDMLWPREVLAEVVAPVEPPSAPFPDTDTDTDRDTDTDTADAGSSVENGPAF